MENQRLKPSAYNIIIEKPDGLAIYNTVTGKMIRCFNDADVVRNILNAEMVNNYAENSIIVKLYECGMLVDANRDEICEIEKKEREGKFGRYMQLILLPTEQCNFRCVYCYERFERGIMSLEIQDAIVNYVEDNIEQFSGLNVIWFGGEPTEALDVIERLSLRMIEVCKRKRKVYNAGITTNGYNLTLENFKKLKKLHITEYQVTIDGLPAIHDRQRFLLNGEKTFEVIMDNLKEIKENIKSSTITFLIRTNFSKEMLEHTDEFCEILDKNLSNDKRFQCFWQMIGDYGYIKDESVKNLFGMPKDYQWLVEKYTSRVINSYTRGLYGPDGGVCYALKRDSIVIDSAGSIRKCTCDLDSNVNYFGKIGGNFDAKKHEEWMNKRNINENSSCYFCKKRPLCHNRACYKAKKCLPNYSALNLILSQMAEDSENYEIIGEKTNE